MRAAALRTRLCFSALGVCELVGAPALARSGVEPGDQALDRVGLLLGDVDQAERAQQQPWLLDDPLALLVVGGLPVAVERPSAKRAGHNACFIDHLDFPQPSRGPSDGHELLYHQPMSPLPRCALHGTELERKKRGWFCDDCGSLVEPASVLTGLGDSQRSELRGWPSVLATPLEEYAREQDPLLRLWLLCEAVELTYRFLFALSVAELVRGAARELPSDLRRRISQHIEVPTLGDWRRLVGIVTTALPPSDLAERVVSLVERHLEPLLAGTEKPATIKSSLSELRNVLAHGGGLSRAVAAKLLTIHAPRFEAVLEAAGWLGEIRLFGRLADGTLVELKGADGAALPASGAELPATQADPVGSVIASWRGESVELWPLYCYGSPQPTDDEPKGYPAVAQVYARKDPAWLLFSAIGSEEVAHGCRRDALDSFARMFARPAKSARTYRVEGFESDIAREDALFHGRVREIAHVREAMGAAPGGVFWIGGAAGSGKSSLLARVAMDLTRAAGEADVVLSYRFRAGDARCSTSSFVQFLCERLERALKPVAHGSSGSASPRDQLRALLRAPTNGRVSIVVDGLDELGPEASEFIRQVVFSTARPGLYWLCAGREQGELSRALAEGSFVSLFPRGLPGMRAEDVRAWLLSESGRMRGKLLQRDSESDGAPSNAFIDAVVERAQGLPLYVRYVVADVAGGRIRTFDEQLPPSVAAYHEKQLRRYALGSLQQVLTPILCSLALALEPLSEAALAAMLMRRTLIDDGSKALVRDALAVLGPMTRQAPAGDGAPGYLLFHQSLREHVMSSPTTAVAVQTARQAFATAAERWHLDEADALSPYLARNGIRHLLEAGRVDAVGRLLTDLGYLLARVTSRFALSGLFSDYGAALQHASPGPISAWHRFLRTRAHAISSPDTLLQEALALPEDSPVAIAAEKVAPTWTRPFLRKRSRSSEADGFVQRFEASQRIGCLSHEPRRGLLAWGEGCDVEVVEADTRWRVVRLEPKYVDDPDDFLDPWADRWMPPDGDVTCVAFHPAGELMLVGHGVGYLASVGNRITVWNTRTATPLRWLSGHEGGVRALALSTDGSRAWTIDGSGTLREFLVSTGACVWTAAGSPVATTGPILDVCEDDQLLLLRGRVLEAWTPGGKEFSAAIEGVDSFAVSEDRQHLALLRGTALEERRGTSLALVATLDAAPLDASSVFAVPGKGRVGIVSRTRGVLLVELASGQVVASASTRCDPSLTPLVWSGGERLFVGCRSAVEEWTLPPVEAPSPASGHSETLAKSKSVQAQRATLRNGSLRLESGGRSLEMPLSCLLSLRPIRFGEGFALDWERGRLAVSPSLLGLTAKRVSEILVVQLDTAAVIGRLPSHIAEIGEPYFLEDGRLLVLAVFPKGTGVEILPVDGAGDRGHEHWHARKMRFMPEYQAVLMTCARTEALRAGWPLRAPAGAAAQDTWLLDVRSKVVHALPFELDFQDRRDFSFSADFTRFLRWRGSLLDVAFVKAGGDFERVRLRHDRDLAECRFLEDGAIEMIDVDGQSFTVDLIASQVRPVVARARPAPPSEWPGWLERCEIWHTINAPDGARKLPSELSERLARDFPRSKFVADLEYQRRREQVERARKARTRDSHVSHPEDESEHRRKSDEDPFALERELRQALDAPLPDAKKASVLLRLGVVREERLGEWVRALEAYQLAFKAFPSWREPLRRARWLYWQMDRLDPLIKVSNIESMMCGDHPDVAVDLGDAWWEKGELAQAITAYEAVDDAYAAANAEDARVAAKAPVGRANELIVEARASVADDARARLLRRAARLLCVEDVAAAEALLTESLDLVPDSAKSTRLFLRLAGGAADRTTALFRWLSGKLTDPIVAERIGLKWAAWWRVRGHVRHATVILEYVARELPRDSTERALLERLRKNWGTS